jgi:hypothetical protein
LVARIQAQCRTAPIGYNRIVNPRVAALVAFSLVASLASSADAEGPELAAPARGAEPDRINEWGLGRLSRFGIAPQLGYHRRLDAPPFFLADERDSLGGGLDVRAYVARRFAIVGGYERLGLGKEQSGVTPYGSARVSRRIDEGWLGVRLEPWSNRWLATSVALGIGIAWQHATATALLWPPFEPGRARSVACGGTGSPAPAMRVELGVEAPLGAGLSFFTTGGFGVLALGDGPVADCVSGAGSAQVLSLRTGFAYTFDVGGGGG